MSKHTDIQERLTELAFGALSSAEEVQLREHLAACEECMAMYAELEQTTFAFEEEFGESPQAPTSLSPDRIDAILQVAAELQAEPETVVPRASPEPMQVELPQKSDTSRQLWYVAAAGIAIVFGLLAFAVHLHRQSVQELARQNENETLEQPETVSPPAPRESIVTAPETQTPPKLQTPAPLPEVTPPRPEMPPESIVEIPEPKEIPVKDLAEEPEPRERVAETTPEDPTPEEPADLVAQPEPKEPESGPEPPKVEDLVPVKPQALTTIIQEPDDQPPKTLPGNYVTIHEVARDQKFMDVTDQPSINSNTTRSRVRTTRELERERQRLRTATHYGYVVDKRDSIEIRFHVKDDPQAEAIGLLLSYMKKLRGNAATSSSRPGNTLVEVEGKAPELRESLEVMKFVSVPNWTAMLIKPDTKKMPDTFPDNDDPIKAALTPEEVTKTLKKDMLPEDVRRRKITLSRAVDYIQRHSSIDIVDLSNQGRSRVSMDFEAINVYDAVNLLAQALDLIVVIRKGQVFLVDATGVDRPVFLVARLSDKRWSELDGKGKPTKARIRQMLLNANVKFSKQSDLAFDNQARLVVIWNALGEQQKALQFFNRPVTTVFQPGK